MSDTPDVVGQQTQHTSGNGEGPDGAGLGVGLEGGSRRRWLEVLAGVAVVGVLALAGGWWHLSSVDRRPVLALKAEVARGETIERSDLQVVNVGADTPVAVLGRSQSAQLVGKTAVADLAAGTLASPGLVTGGPALEPDEAQIGIAVAAGGMPAAGLAPGDTVAVIDVGEGGGRLAEAEVAEVSAGAAEGQVSPGGRVVRLQVPAPVMSEVAAAAAADQVRLAWIDGGGSS